MMLACRGTIKDLIKKYRVRPSKRLGQHFLIDKRVIKKVIEAANLKPGDTVLEIGPGIGVLTQELAKGAKKIVAVEKDPKMAEILRGLLEGLNVGNVEIIKEDILKIDPKTYNLKPKTYKVVANIPYYLTSTLIRKFLECNEERPRYMILIVQKEVAQRICARPPEMSILAVSVQFYANPEIVSYISKKSFWPSPKVDSAIIKIIPRKSALLIRVNPLLFFKIVKAGFSHPRKQLINNLSKGLKIDREKIRNFLLKNNIKPEQRAETLTVENWISLTKSFNSMLK